VSFMRGGIIPRVNELFGSAPLQSQKADLIGILKELAESEEPVSELEDTLEELCASTLPALELYGVQKTQDECVELLKKAIIEDRALMGNQAIKSKVKRRRRRRRSSFEVE